MNATPHVAQNTSGRTAAIDGPDDAPRGLCHQPADAQAHRGSLRLDEDGRRPGDKFRGRERVGPSPSPSPPTISCACRSS